MLLANNYRAYLHSPAPAQPRPAASLKLGQQEAACVSRWPRTSCNTGGKEFVKVRALFNPRDVVGTTLADDDEELILDPLAERLAEIDGDLLRTEVGHLQRQLALEHERSDVLGEQLDTTADDLRVATARLNTRSIIDAAEDVMGAPDAGGKAFAAAAGDTRHADRANKWAAWAADNPDEAAELAEAAGWDFDNLAEEVADLYEQIRSAGASLPSDSSTDGRKHRSRHRSRSGGIEPLLAAANDVADEDASSGTSEDWSSGDESGSSASDDEATVGEVFEDDL